MGTFWQVSNVTLKSSQRRCCIKKAALKFSNIYRKTLLLESLFNKFAGLQGGNLIKKRLQHMHFPVRIAKFLKTSILKDTCERLNFIHSKWKKK